MSITCTILLVISVLVLLDGMLCLLFLERFESALKRIWPGLNVVPIAAAEIILGGTGACLILFYC